MNEEDILEEIKTESKKSTKYKTKTCKILRYNKLTNILYLDFDGFGIEIPYDGDLVDDFINVQYTSDIGKEDFTFKLEK